MKNLFIIVLLTVLTPVLLKGQRNLNFSVGSEYWQHTSLWGFQGNIDYSFKVKKNLFLNFGFGFGYGEKNRLNDFPQSDGKLTTLNVGYSSTYVLEYGVERIQTDNAKQVKLSVGVCQAIDINSKQKFLFYTSIFGKKINHFFVVDKLKDGYEINYGDLFVGPLDVYIVTQQSFYTIGIEQKISYSFELKEGKFISPYLIGGYGYNQTSFYGIGLSVGGVL